MDFGLINSALLATAALGAMLLLKRAGQISSEKARACLRSGALIIDVRSRQEFNSSHLAGAINIPLQELESRLPQLVKEKDRGLLLHCHSGVRSGVAKHRLKAMGYNKVYNLGSYSRAASIVSSE